MKKLKFLPLLLSVCFLLLSVPAFGMPYWTPDDWSQFENFHAENPPRVVDNADLLSSGEEAILAELVQKVVDTYQIGYVILTDVTTNGMDEGLYSADFLYANGYGMGDEYSAICFFLDLDPENRCWYTNTIGQCENDLPWQVIEDIDDTVDSDIRNGRYFDAFCKHAVYIFEHYRKLNADPEYLANFLEEYYEEHQYGNEYYYGYDDYGYGSTRSSEEKPRWLFVVVGLVIGLIVASIVNAKNMAKMTLQPARDAGNYLAQGSYRLRNRRVDFLYTSVSRVRRDTDSGSRSGGGGSYHSSGHSSGGGHYSGGGRHF